MEKFIGPHLKFLQICELQLKSLPITDIKIFTSDKGVFKNYIDKILDFLDQLPPYVYIFYGMNVDKKCAILDHLSTSSCKRSLWTILNSFFGTRK